MYNKVVTEIICEKAYLYSAWTGRLRVDEGTVYRTDFGDGRTREYHVSNDSKTRRCCSMEPGVVNNKTVWLPERDDDKACAIMIEYEQAQINRLKEQIERHEILIETLKMGL